MGREQIRGMVRIVVAERHHPAAAKLGPRPQAGMRELVEQHQILAPGKRRQDAGIGEIARAEDAGGLGALEPGEPRLELLDRADGCR